MAQAGGDVDAAALPELLPALLGALGTVARLQLPNSADILVGTACYRVEAAKRP
jgi:hypothetical protein